MSVYSILEAFALLIAALGHGISEKCATTKFEMTRGTVLASLYSSPGSMAQVLLILFIKIILKWKYYFIKDCD